MAAATSIATGSPTGTATTFRRAEDTARQAAMEAASVARQAEEAAIVASSDTDLVARLAECNRVHWTAVQNGTTPVPYCGSFLQMQYATRSRTRQMPPIPMPTDIPAYQRYAAYQQSKQWMDDNLPRGAIGAPLRLYVSAAAVLKTGMVRENPSTGSEKLAAIGILALPFVSGYVAHKKTDGNLKWTLAAGAGSVPALMLLFGALGVGSMFIPGVALILTPVSMLLGPAVQPLMAIFNY
jgi:hypothetical protein